MVSQTTPVRDDKLLGLEVLRFLSAIAVLVWHYQHFAFNGTRVDVVRPEQPFYALLKPLYEHGYLGVQVFWCISGFIFFWKYGQAIAEHRVGARKFFVLRFSRLYPLHLATLLLVLALQPLYQWMHGQPFVYQHNDAGHFVRQLLLASNWADANDWSFNGPIWSISVEVLVYAVFFVLLRLFGPSRGVAAVVVALGTVAMLARLPWPVLACSAFFFAGGLAALGLRHRRFPDVRWAAGWLGVLVAASVVRRLAPDQFAFVCILTVLPLLLWIIAPALRRWPGWLRGGIEAAGNLTYASYLLHFPLQLALTLCFAALHRPIPLYSARFFLVFMVAVLVLSALVYRGFEVPVQAWIRRRALQPSFRPSVSS